MCVAAKNDWFMRLTLGIAWINLLREVLNRGTRIEDSTGAYLELDCLQFATDAVSPTDPIIQRNVLAKNIEEMEKVFLTNSHNAFGHSYWELICGGESNQFQRVVTTLRNKPQSRKAIIVLGVSTNSAPCINTMHFYLRNKRLHLTYFSRGQDLWLKFCPDVLAIRKLQAMIAAELGNVELGPIQGVISSAHIYLTDEPAVAKAVHDAQL